MQKRRIKSRRDNILIVRWVAAPGEEWGITGVSVSVSGSTLSAYTGGSVGLMGAHIIFEPF